MGLTNKATHIEAVFFHFMRNLFQTASIIYIVSTVIDTSNTPNTQSVIAFKNFILVQARIRIYGKNSLSHLSILKWYNLSERAPDKKSMKVSLIDLLGLLSGAGAYTPRK